MTQLRRIVLWIVWLGVCAGSAAAQCDVTQTLKPWQVARLAALEGDLNLAFARNDSYRVQELLREQRLTLGVEAGYPLFAEQWIKLSTRTRWLTLEQVIVQAEKNLDKQPELFGQLGRMARGFLPGTQGSPNLSPVAAGEYGLALLQLANLSTDDTRRARLLNLGLHTLDTLMQLRQGGATFPFLDLKGRFLNPPPLLTRYYPPIPHDTVALPAKGWLSYDYGTGEAYQVNGKLMSVYAKAYAETNFPAYKQVGERLARHLLTQAPVAAMRHNAALVTGLCYAYSLLEDTDYLSRATAVTRLALLPAQLPTGRWPDSLDAQAQSQSDLVIALASLYGRLADTARVRPQVQAALLRAGRNLTAEYLRCGATADIRWVFVLQELTDQLPASFQDSLRVLSGRLLHTGTPWLDDIPMLATYARMLRFVKFQTQAADPSADTPPPGSLTLEQFPLTPNPFSDYTLVSFELPERLAVRLEVRDARGKPVATLLNETRDAGIYHIRWDCSGKPPGTYLFQLTIKGRGYLRKGELVR
ncbi:MAG: hypothetical protein KF690_05960 [Bacteroidetes bacterium]|nr:hypothetical protein [Bacteroidota bacterium]